MCSSDLKLSEMIANLGVNVISEDIARGNLFADFKDFNLEKLAAERNEAALASQDNNEAYNCQPETYLVKQWAYMNRILKAAQWAAEQGDEIHFVQMTSFGCGPDSFIQDEIRDIMKRHNKPFTLLKIDDVSNIGSLKLRVRSLIESLKGVKEVKSEERRVKNSLALLIIKFKVDSSMFKVIDTHTHFDAEEFDEDRAEAFARARDAGVGKVFLPAIDVKTTHAVLALSREYPGYAYPMIGLHPEEVKADWKEQLAELRKILEEHRMTGNASQAGSPQFSDLIAIGEVLLYYYWSREFENEQLEAFEEQVKWSVETQLPLMIHCRKAQNEMVHLLRKYEKELPGGVFHCFTGNQKEAEELLSFDNFVLGIGGVSTFKSSHLREDLPAVVPMNRIVLETDSPYMAPVPYRGKRNESAFVVEVMKTLAKAYGVSEEEFARQTNINAESVFRYPYPHYRQ